MKGHLGFSIKSRPFQPFAVIILNYSSLPYFLPTGATSVTAWVIGGGGQYQGSGNGSLDEEFFLSNLYAGDNQKGGWSGAWTRATWDIRGHAADEFFSLNARYDEVAHPIITQGVGLSFRGATLFASNGPHTGMFSDWTSTWGWYENTADPEVNNTYGANSNPGTIEVFRVAPEFGGFRFRQQGGALVAPGPCDTSRRCASLVNAGIPNLADAVALAGEKVIEDDAPLAPAFGSGAFCTNSVYGGSSGTYLKPGIGGGGAAVIGGYPTGGPGAIVLYFT